jgi:glycosyltransferase involved in cell wall biosynthesis
VKILFITRATLYKNRGGDTIQVLRTADHLRKLGIAVDIQLTNEVTGYEGYDLLHFFNIIRPADILHHITCSGKPYVISTIYVDYYEFEKKARKGFTRMVFRLLSADQAEYLKVVARLLVNGEKVISPSYLFYGQRRAVRKIIRGSALLLPNSASEYHRLYEHYREAHCYTVIPNAIDPLLFGQGVVAGKGRDPDLVICVGRIEGIKNQLNLIRALNGTRYRLIIIGSPSENQKGYYKECRKEAAGNISFIAAISQEELTGYYTAARVHALPSWFETTGLSSLEAAAMGCNLVITDKGDTREYFENYAWYCDPASPQSILAAVGQAAAAEVNEKLRQKIFSEYTWARTAEKTADAYKKALHYT